MVYWQRLKILSNVHPILWISSLHLVSILVFYFKSSNTVLILHFKNLLSLKFKFCQIIWPAK